MALLSDFGSQILHVAIDLLLYCCTLSNNSSISKPITLTEKVCGTVPYHGSIGTETCFYCTCIFIVSSLWYQHEVLYVLYVQYAVTLALIYTFKDT
jgi:hypothetical protein